jgi:probable phosphoglycerate mutase
MEIHAGQWQGLLRQDIITKHPEWVRRDLSALEIYEMAEGGEGLAAFHARITSFLDDLVEPTVVVAHGLLGQVLRAQVRGLDIGQAGHLSNDQGCVYVLENGVETVLTGDN